MEVNEPVTVPVTAKPTPRVTLDSYFRLDRLARRVRGEKFMSKSMALSSVLQEASPRSPPCFSFRWRWLHFVIAPFNCDYKKRCGQRKTKECRYWRTYKGTPGCGCSLGYTPSVCHPASEYGGLWWVGFKLHGTRGRLAGAEAVPRAAAWADERVSRQNTRGGTLSREQHPQAECSVGSWGRTLQESRKSSSTAIRKRDAGRERHHVSVSPAVELTINLS